ncbi:MAG: endonuclease NucS [Xanthobacteraceae bacterium]|nr:endonuclease NucS [Xanthobacteraceae bacterium]
MPKTWIIAPVEANPVEVFDRVWRFDLSNNVISIGWNELGNVSSSERENLIETVAKKYPNNSPRSQAHIVNTFWNFYHEIEVGDVVLARRGRKTLVGVGDVTAKAQYTPGRNEAVDHANFLEVAWRSSPRDKQFGSIVFPMQTISQTTEEAARRLTEVDKVAVELAIQEDDQIDPQAFFLEKYLEDFIVDNFQSIFKGTLKVYEESEEFEGQQFTTDVGSIDILAIEKSSGDFVVIELKKGRHSDRVVGQTLRYMGWVKENLCKDGQGVRGLIITRDADKRLTYALSMTSGVEVRHYKIDFELRDPSKI